MHTKIHIPKHVHFPLRFPVVISNNGIFLREMFLLVKINKILNIKPTKNRPITFLEVEIGNFIFL